MANNNQSPENTSVAKSVETRNEGSLSDKHSVTATNKRGKYSEVQSAARFPIKLPISVKSKSGECHTESQNISANGVLFQVDSEMPVGLPVDFTISLPAGVLGVEGDVQLGCRGRVVRNFEDGGRRDVGVVIDEYRFDRR